MRIVIALATLGLAAASPAVANAAEAVLPLDGATVSSRPTFTFDFAEGSVDVEWSKASDLLTAGDSVGSFVDRAGWNGGYITGAGPTVSIGAGESVSPGAYYWHARARDESTGYETQPWGPLRVMHVPDEPPVIEGWTMSTKRLKPNGTCDQVRIRGAVKIDDNEEFPRSRLTVVLRAGGKTLRGVGKVVEIDSVAPTYERVLCTPAANLNITLEVTDPAGHTTTSEVRLARVPAAKHRSPSEIARQGFADVSSAVRRGDGKTACALMTSRYRSVVRGILDPDGWWDNCEEAVSMKASTLRSFVNGTARRARIRGTRATLLASSAGYWYMRLIGTHWRLDNPPLAELSRWPHVR